KVKAMTRDQRDMFLATAERVEPWWAPAWTIQVLAGLRPGELLALEERDLDLMHHTLRVERALSVDGQRVDKPKGGCGRDVDLSNEAGGILRAHLSRRREEKLSRGWHALPRPLFCSTTGTYADPSGMREAFRKVCLAAGFTDERPGRDGTPRSVAKFSPHGL